MVMSESEMEIEMLKERQIKKYVDGCVSEAVYLHEQMFHKKEDLKIDY